MDKTLFDPSLRAAQFALDGLAFRRDLISHNIANVDTPGYHAMEVDFENVLQKALRSVDTISMASSNSRHLTYASEPTDLFRVENRPGGTNRADENNVDIDLELTQLTETGVRYQALTKIVSKKMSLLKSIAT